MEHPPRYRIHPDFRLNGTFPAQGDLAALGKGLLSGTEFEASMGEFLLAWASECPTVEVMTSGSTGRPKGIGLKKRQMVHSALATGRAFGLKAGQTALLCLPCSGIAGKMMLVRAMVLGLELDAVEPSSAPMPPNGRTYDFVAMVPLQFQNSLAELDRIGVLIIGGAPLDAHWKDRLRSRGTRVYETYGMTETISHIAIKEIAPDPSPFFQCLPGVTPSLDSRGCLVIEAPGISDVPVVTNDLVEPHGGNGFKWLGRYDSIINSGGIKLIPERIEEQLAALIDARFFVAGIPDKALGQRLVLVVEGRAPQKERLLQRVKALEGLSKYELPKEVHYVESFVETPSRKVQRKKTLELLF